MFGSPVPTQIEWSAGLNARAPTERLSCWSNTGVQFWPPSNDRQTPPAAAPAKIVWPSAARAVIRPDTSPAPPLELDHVGSR